LEEDINEPTQKALEMASVSNAIEFYLRAIAIPVISRNFREISRDGIAIGNAE